MPEKYSETRTETKLTPISRPIRRQLPDGRQNALGVGMRGGPGRTGTWILKSSTKCLFYGHLPCRQGLSSFRVVNSCRHCILATAHGGRPWRERDMVPTCSNATARRIGGYDYARAISELRSRCARPTVER